MSLPSNPEKRSPFSTRSLLADFVEGRIALARSTEHFAYSRVFLTEYPSTDVFLLSSGEPIDFAEMPVYYSQIESIDAVAAEAGIVQRDGASPMWLYHNEPGQPLGDSDNPVRSPFRFEIGYEIEPAAAFSRPSAAGGTFLVAELRPLQVASVVYKGSPPHGADSGFVEACQTLLPAVARAGLRCAYTLYREIYHLTDWDSAEASITEVQIEVC